MTQKLKINDQALIVDGTPMGGDEVTLEGIVFDRVNRRLSVGNVSVASFLEAYGITNPATQDCSDAIDAAVAELTARGGGQLFFPYGVYRITRRILIGRRYVDEGEYRYYGYLILTDHGPSWNQAEFDASHTNTTIEIVGDKAMLWGDFTSPMSPVSASGTTPPTITLAGTPEVAHVRIGITVGGLSDGTAQWRFSTDGGATWSSASAVPNGGGPAPLTGTGLTATFANGTYNTDNAWVSDQLITALLYYGLSASNGGTAKIEGMRFLGRDAAVNGVPVFWGDIAAPAQSGQMGLFMPGSNFSEIDNNYFYGLDTALLLSDVYWTTVSHCFTFSCLNGICGHRINASRVEQCAVANAGVNGFRLTGQGFRMDGIYTEQADLSVWFPFATDVVWTNAYLEDEAPTSRASIVLGDVNNDAQHVCGLRISGGFSHSHNYFIDARQATGVVIEAMESGRDDGQYAFLFRDAYSRIKLIDPVHDIQQFTTRHDIVDPTGFDGLTIETTGTPLPPSDVTTIKFDRPQVPAPAMKFLGGRLDVRRNSGANMVIDGELHVADVNQPRIDDVGLLVEPGAENLLSDTLNLAAVTWVTSHFPLTANQPDPEGNLTASVYRGAVEGAAFDHLLYQAGTLAATTTTFSFYFGYLPGNIVTAVRMGDNSSAHFAYFDFVNEVVKSTTGATTHAEIERIGTVTTSDGTFTVFRCSVTCTPSTGLLMTVYPSTTGTGTSFQDDGTGRLWLWHPQTETSPYATTWVYPTNNPRDDEDATIPIPNLGAEWCIEATVEPAGPSKMRNAYPGAGGWNRGSHVPILSLGTYGAANSLELYAMSDPDGHIVASVFDSAGDEQTATSDPINIFNYYMGPKRVAIASTGRQRPEIYVDGRKVPVTMSGTGTGVFDGAGPYLLRLGSTSAGVYGGWHFREVTIRTGSAIPTGEPVGQFPHQWSMDRGYVPRAKCIAFLGDSNMSGVYDAAVTPYPFGTITVDQQAHIYAIGGNTAHQALVRWRRDIRGRGYKKMLLQIGINDIDTSFPAAQIIADITQIVREALIDGVHVAIGTMFPTNLTPGDYKLVQHTAVNDAIRALAAQNLFVTRCSLADFYATLEDPDNPGNILPAYMHSGGLPHLSQAGQDALAPVAAAALAAIT